MTSHRPSHALARGALCALVTTACCSLSWPVFAQNDGASEPPEPASKPAPSEPDAPSPPDAPDGERPEQPAQPDEPDEPEPGPAEPLDPYAPGGDLDEQEPLDPYGSPTTGDPAGDSTGDSTGDPTDDSTDAEKPPKPSKPDKGKRKSLHKGLILYSGAFGATLFMAAAGPRDSTGAFGFDAKIAGWIGLGVGLGAGYLVSRKAGLTDAQANLASWAGIWGGLITGLGTDLATGVGDTDYNDAFKGVALGGVWGMLTGLAHGTGGSDLTESDVALFNSGGLYGLSTALLLADVLNPPTVEAYSINALIGSLGGLSLGAIAAKRWDVSARRVHLVDLGVMAGGLAPWVVLYPIIADRAYARQITSTLSFLGMLGGGYYAWRATRGMRATTTEKGEQGEQGEKDDKRAALPPIPGLVQRTEYGTWRLGPPSLRPGYNPNLAAGEMARHRSVVVDILGGRF